MTETDQYTITPSGSILDALRKLEELSFQSAMAMFVVNEAGRTVGSITAGDVRRGLLHGLTLESKVSEVMNPNFTYLTQGDIEIEKLKLIKKNQLKIVPVLNGEGELTKILNFQIHRSYLPLDAVLMAGGRGERLRPATLSTPKPLLKIGQKAIIDYNVDNLTDNGIENISVTVNYMAEKIEEHFTEPKNGVRVRCVREPEFLGTMGSIRFIETWHNDTILVMNSDLFTNIDLEDFFLHFKENNADMSIAAIPYSVSIPYGVFEIQDTHNIKGIREKPSFHYHANAGIYLIKREVLDIIPKGEFFNATDLMEKLIAQNKNVIRFPLSGYWIDIGKPEDFQKAQELVKHTKQR